MYNSQYYTCEQIDERLLQGYLDDYNTQTGQSLTKAQFLTKLGSIFSKEGVIDNTATQIGYYECDTAAGTAAKAITVANYALFAGGSMKVKFANKNTANNATLNINSQGAKALYYQGERASATNSWDADEVVEIYYDGTSYYANNVKGGSGSGVYDVSKEHPTSGPNSDGKFTLEYILNPSNVNELIPVNKRYPGMSIQFVSTSDNNYVQFRLMHLLSNASTAAADFANTANWQGVDDEPTSGSDNLVKSGGVAKKIIEVDNKISESEEINHNLSESGYLKTDGTIYPTQNGAHTNHINLVNCVVLKAKTYISNLGYAIAFYDVNNNLLTDISIVGNGSTNTTIDLTQSQYENATYAVVSAYNQNQDFTGYYAKTISQDGEVIQRIKDEKTRAEGVEQTLQQTINTEKTRNESVDNIFNERLSTVEQAISESNVSYDFTESGYIRVSDGQIQETSRGGHTTHISLTGRSTLEVKTTISNLGYAIAFYDINNNLLTDISIVGNGSTNTTIDLTQSQYENATYAVACIFTSSGDFTGYYAKTTSEDGEIIQKIKDEKILNEITEKSLGISRFAKPIYDYNVILIYGQSLANGQQTCPPLSTLNYRGNLMIGKEWATGNSIVDMIAKCPNYTQEQAESAQKSDQELAESPGINLCNAIKYMIDDACMQMIDRKVLIVNGSASGQSIELLSKNCPNNNGSDYSSMITKLNKAKNLSDAVGKTSGCIGIVWMQGEWNGRAKPDQGWTDGTDATTNKDDYKALLIGGTTSDNVTHNGLLPDIISDVKTIFGQFEQPVCICTQTGIGTNNTKDMPIDMALLEASDEFFGLFMAGSSYSVPNRGTHLDPNGSRWVGEFLAKTYYNVIFKNIDYKPLKPVGFSKYNDRIHIIFNNKTPLQLNTSILQKKTDYGFSVYVDGTKRTITAIILNTSSVDICVEGSLDGVIEVTYAGMDVDYGNLCDSDSWKSFEKYKELPSQLKPSYEPRLEGLQNLYNVNYPMFNFSVKWYYQIPDKRYFIKC